MQAASNAALEGIRTLAPHDPQSHLIAMLVEHLALALALAGDLERASRLAGYADASLMELGVKREFTEMTTYNRITTLLHESLEPADRERLRAEGAALSPKPPSLSRFKIRRGHLASSGLGRCVRD